MFLLVPAYPGSPGSTTVKVVCSCVLCDIYIQLISLSGVANNRPTPAVS